MSEKYDICVIGSGAGGAPIACKLAQKGLKVIILERGNLYSAKDFIKDELTACRRDFFFPDHSRGLREVKYGSNPYISGNHLWTGACVGGGTVRMSGFFFRMREEDFSPLSNYGQIPGATQRDWPINYNDLQKYYNEIESDIGISGHAQSIPGIKNLIPFSLPPLKSHAFSILIDRACGDMGYHPFPTPRAVLSRNYKDRGECSYTDFCGSYGCTTGAKASTLVTYIKTAMETGNAELLPNCCVYKLECSGNKITEAHFFNSQDIPNKVKARIFILACSSIETARLLLNSKNLRFPHGLANSSGQVGKNLTFQMPCTVTAFFKKSILPENHLEGSPFVQRCLQDFHNLESDRLIYPRAGTVIFLLPHPNPINKVMMLSFGKRGQRIWGIPLKQRIRDYFNYLHLQSDSFIEFLPNPETCITLSKDKRDYWGIPVAKISIKPHEENLKAAEILALKISEIYHNMGAVKAVYNNLPFTAGELQHGTCRFGYDPQTSVLNPLCRSHDINNLYVTDGSFMPSGLPVPSTYTIMANSLRIADFLYNNG
ncbi:MAG: GMC family oxidoreductase [bacterium]